MLLGTVPAKSISGAASRSDPTRAKRAVRLAANSCDQSCPAALPAHFGSCCTVATVERPVSSPKVSELHPARPFSIGPLASPGSTPFWSRQTCASKLSGDLSRNSETSGFRRIGGASGWTSERAIFIRRPLPAAGPKSAIALARKASAVTVPRPAGRSCSAEVRTRRSRSSFSSDGCSARALRAANAPVASSSLG